MRALQKKREANISGELAELGGRGATSACLLPLLGMGRDVADGRLGIDAERRLTCDWAIDRSRPFFEEVMNAARIITAELGGELWDTAIGELERIVTVHPLA